MINVFFNFAKNKLRNIFSRITFVVLTMFSYQFAVAQDKIIKLSRDTINCKVTEVGPDFIRYNVVVKNETALKSIDRRDVLRVFYANGQVDSISGKRIIAVKLPLEKTSDKSETQNPKPQIVKDKKKDEWFLYFTFTDLYANLISGGFMYTFRGGYIGVEVPVSFGMVYLGILDTVTNRNTDDNSKIEPIGYFNSNKIFSSGLSINYYPFPLYKSQFFVSLSFTGGQFKYSDDYFDYTGGTGYNSKESTGSFGSFIPKVGTKLLLRKNLQMSINFGLGVLQSKRSYFVGVPDKWYTETKVGPALEAGIHIGYKF